MLWKFLKRRMMLTHLLYLIVIRGLKNIFIDGLRQKKTAQLFIQEDVPNLQAVLSRAIRQELLQHTFQRKLIMIPMEVDHVDQNNAELGT